MKLYRRPITGNAKRSRKPPERIEQAHCEAFIKWCEIYPDIRRDIYHIPNEGKRGMVAAIHLKKMGLTPGVLDYFFQRGLGSYHGLYIEFKTPGEKLTASQRKFRKNTEANNYKCVVVYSWVEARDELENYLKLGD